MIDVIWEQLRENVRVVGGWAIVQNFLSARYADRRISHVPLAGPELRPFSPFTLIRQTKRAQY